MRNLVRYYNIFGFICSKYALVISNFKELCVSINVSLFFVHVSIVSWSGGVGVGNVLRKRDGPAFLTQDQ